MSAVTLRYGDGEPIAITAFGMVSSLGIDAISACAAARAGLSRAAPIEDVLAWDDAEAAPVPVHGHAVRQVTQGFAGVGRLARLGAAAWEDLERRGQQSAPGTSYGLYVATTSGYYTAEARGLGEEDERAEVIAEAQADHQAKVAGPLLQRLLGIRHGPPPTIAKVIIGQQAAFAAALIEAMSDLRTGVVDECIVGAVDSLIDPAVVGALSELGMLKTPENAGGVAPGEGAAFLRLSRLSAVPRDQTPAALVTQVAWDRETGHRFADEDSHEQALLGLLRDAPPTVQGAGRPPLIIGTLNGDPVRAMEWGRALVALPKWAHDAEHRFPAASFGDVGAAAGAMNTVVGLRALARERVAAYPSALVWAAGDDGGKAAIWMQSATGSVT